MIQQQTILSISDNSGAKTARCIKVLNGFKKRYARIGNLIVVSIQKLRNRLKDKSKISKGEITKALVIRTKTKYKRKDGSIYFLSNNSAILMTKQGHPLATRVFGPLPRNLKKKRFMKFASLSVGRI